MSQQGYFLLKGPAGKIRGSITSSGHQETTKDYAEAVRWYRKAAEQNYAKAQSNLADCYENGRGVMKDDAEAYKWLLLAAGQGDARAKEAMATLEEKMTPEQIAEGQKRARDFKPR